MSSWSTNGSSYRFIVATHSGKSFLILSIHLFDFFRLNLSMLEHEIVDLL